jgi:hypothetical protein
VSFDEALQPVVQDESGARLRALPKPGAKDDRSLADPAEARFKLLKKSVREMARVQVARLQRAMVTGRRWSRAEFQTYLVERPLMVHLVRRLIWGTYAGDRLVHTFRVAEDWSFADGADDAVVPPADTAIGVAHPVDLPDGSAAEWGERLADYELLQPFSQLGDPSSACATARIPRASSRRTSIARFRSSACSGSRGRDGSAASLRMRASSAG